MKNTRSCAHRYFSVLKQNRPFLFYLNRETSRLLMHWKFNLLQFECKIVTSHEYNSVVMYGKYGNWCKNKETEHILNIRQTFGEDDKMYVTKEMTTNKSASNNSKQYVFARHVYMGNTRCLTCSFFFVYTTEFSLILQELHNKSVCNFWLFFTLVAHHVTVKRFECDICLDLNSKMHWKLLLNRKMKDMRWMFKFAQGINRMEHRCRNDKNIVYEFCSIWNELNICIVCITHMKNILSICSWAEDAFLIYCLEILIKFCPSKQS